MKQQRVWLRSDHPVRPLDSRNQPYIAKLEAALRQGLPASADPEHDGFYEVVLGELWHYVHIPRKMPGIFLVAVGRVRSVMPASA